MSVRAYEMKQFPQANGDTVTMLSLGSVPV